MTLGRTGLRYALVRIWSAVTVGLLAGVLGDGGTEFFAALGWLGGAARDVDHQGILPAFALGFTLALALAGYVAGSRIAPNDPLLRKLDDARARALDAATAFAGSCVTVVAVEGYETHFGGLAPFDARSVVVAHAPILIVSFLVIAVAARIVLGAALRCAAQGGTMAAALWTSFLRISRLRVATPKHATTSHPGTSCSHVAPDIVNARGLRAPPRTPFVPASITR